MFSPSYLSTPVRPDSTARGGVYDTPSASKGVELHNDVKPSNVLLALPRHAGERMRGFLADVGLAQLQEEGHSHVSLASVAGTTGFIDPVMSDEQARCLPPLISPDLPP